MDRRTFVVAAGMALAGCSQGGDGGNGTTTTTEETTETTTTEATTTTASGPPLEVTEVSVPTSIQIGTTATLSATVRNNTDSERTYESGVSRQIQSGEWTELDATLEVTVPAGETATGEVEVPAYEYMKPGTYRLDDGEHLVRTLFVTRELEMGETYVAPTGVEITVEEVTFPEQYTYDSEEGTQTRDPPTNGERWAVTHLTVSNPTGEAVQSPTTEAIVLRMDGENEFGDMVFDPKNLDQYTSVTLQPGENVSGEIASDVSTDIPAEDLYVGYDKEFDEGRAKAQWPVPAQS